MKRHIINLCALVGLVVNLSAATYYVDFAAGLDSNSGTSEGAPWKHVKGDPNATGTAAAATLAAGDRIKFKGGTPYIGLITIATSGSLASSIIYDGNSAGDWGTGRAVIDGNHTPSVNLLTFSASVSNIIWRGFKMRKVAGYADGDPALSLTCPADAITSPDSGGAIDLTLGGNRNIIIDDCEFEEIGQWRNQQPFSGTGSITGTAVSLQNCSFITITNCVSSKAKVSLSIKATTLINDILVTNCRFTNYGVWPMDIAPRLSGAVLSNIVIQGTSLSDYHYYDSGNWLGCGEKPHTDGIFFRTAGILSYWYGCKVINCSFFADNPGSSVGGTASIYISQGPSVDIYNNTFINDRHGRSVGVGHNNPSGFGLQVVRIMNNVFVDNYGSSILLAGETNVLKREVKIWNNIFRRDNAANALHINWDSGVKPEVDYNLHYSPTYGETVKNVLYELTAYRKFGVLPSRGFETNGIWGDPLFVDISSPIPSHKDVRVLAGSPALGAGKDLSAYFTTDRDGTTITDWHIGAYTGTATAADPDINTATIDSTGTNWTLAFNKAVFVGSGGSGGFTATMTLGAQTLTYQTGSGSASLNYTSSRINYAGETGTISYVQPGSGIEDGTGVDVASFSDLAIVNNSSQQQPAPSGASFSAKLGGLRGFRIGEVEASETPHNHPATPLLFENFEGSGYATAGWAEYLLGTGNSINEDNTTNVLSGEQSYALVGIADDPSFSTNSFAASSAVYGYFQFKCLKYPNETEDRFRQILALHTDSGTAVFRIRQADAGGIYIETGGSADVVLIGALTLGQTYHIWWSWVADNGSNSAATISISTDKNKPTSGDGFLSITGTQIASDASVIMLGYPNNSEEGSSFDGSPSWIYDYLLLDNEEILSYP